MIPKFRAWDKEDESWIDIKSLGMMEGEITTLEEWDDDLPYFIEDLGKTWELMQATGLHDVNGKEIFEGDIVQCWYEKGFVVMRQGSWFIETDKEYLGALYEYSDEARVIGNIHEHNHLLDDGGQ
ncbi:hypothetical protein CW662_00220 [Macrococcoides caseolyticum]|uniref:YopX family protein n=1 Tax=Macrococcoides caseolyticum TaxID=69966 RepID=UPI000C347AEF|nr:YopX family protein [Macrococcus caseolyticus]PKE70962.1 hypothetical protein CW662_00220 [Macrococcus caseolyticus]